MADAAVHVAEQKPGFFTRWFCSTNHKDIGILYLVTAALVGVIATGLSIVMRLELMETGVQFVPDGHVWNVLITGHGVLMMFFVIIPAMFGGFGNYFLPLHIGAPDMAFPRLNNLSYWLFVAGATMAVLSLVLPGVGARWAPASAGRFIRHFLPRKRGWPPISASSRSTYRVRHRSSARST